MSRNTVFGSLTVAGALVGVTVSALSNPPQRPSQPAVPLLVQAEPQLALASAPPRRSGEAATCSPWEVSEIAMETILCEMIRRGWRPPTQREAVDAFQPTEGTTIVSLDPDALIPYRRPSSVSSEPADPEGLFPVDEIEPDQLTVPVEPAPPEPSIVTGEPTPAPG